MKITYFVPYLRQDSTKFYQCVEAIKAQEGGNEWRLVAVCDGVPNFNVRDDFDLVALHEKNRGLAASCNSALAACDTELFAKVDDDVVLAPDWERRCLVDLLGAGNSSYHSLHNVAAVGGRLIETVRSLADQWRAAFMAQGWQAHDFLSGFATMFRTEALRAVGGWDERYKTNYEDVDLSRRLVMGGFRIVHNPAILARHLKEDTIESVLRTFWRWHKPAIDCSDEGRREIWRNMAVGQIRGCCNVSGIAHLAWISFQMFFNSCSMDETGSKNVWHDWLELAFDEWPWPDDFDPAERFVLEASRRTLGGQL